MNSLMFLPSLLGRGTSEAGGGEMPRAVRVGLCPSTAFGGPHISHGEESK